MTTDEELPIDTVIATAVAMGNVSGPWQYFITTAGQLTSTDGLFKINVHDGTISNNQVIDADSLRSGTATTLRKFISVVAFDGPTKIACNIIINVDDINDNAPTLAQESYALSIDENTAAGTLLPASFKAVDGDAGVNAYIYAELLMQAPPNFFVLEQVQIGSEFQIVRTAKELDYEKLTMIHLQLRLTDAGNPSLFSTSDVVINVKNLNDNPVSLPILEYKYEASEKLAVSTIIGQIVAVDLDGPFTDGDGQRHIYSIFGEDATTFTIDPTAGTLVLASPLDFESQINFTFYVNVHDGTTNFTSQVMVTVLDFNDNAPQFEDAFVSLSYPENYSVRMPCCAPLPVINIPAFTPHCLLSRISTHLHGGFIPLC